MIAPPSFVVVRGPLMRALGWLLLVALALLAVPSAFAGDQPPPKELNTIILTGPPRFTTSTTADFTFTSENAEDPEFMCALDDELYAPCDSDTWHRENIAPGSHLFWVYVRERHTPRRDGTPANWEWVVVASPPLDAGSPDDDGGSPGGDAGTGDTDGGPSGTDAGAGDTDGGTAETDGGPGGNDAGTAEDDAGPGDTDGGSPGDEDGGTPGDDDGGTSGGEDSGTSGEDAGTSGEDGGTPPDEDAGEPGTVPPDGERPPNALDYLGGGMGCTGAPAPGALAGLLLLVLALHRRRRR